MARTVNSRAGHWFERNIWRIGVCVWSCLLVAQAWRHHDEHWNWLFSVSVAVGALTVVTLAHPWVRQRAGHVRLFAGGLVATGLTLVGIPSDDPSLTVALFLSLAGPAVVVLAAQTVTTWGEQHESASRERHSLQVQQAQLLGLIQLQRIATTQERRYRARRRTVAGHRRRELAERRRHANITVP